MNLLVMTISVILAAIVAHGEYRRMLKKVEEGKVSATTWNTKTGPIITSAMVGLVALAFTSFFATEFVNVGISIWNATATDSSVNRTNNSGSTTNEVIRNSRGDIVSVSARGMADPSKYPETHPDAKLPFRPLINGKSGDKLEIARAREMTTVSRETAARKLEKWIDINRDNLPTANINRNPRIKRGKTDNTGKIKQESGNIEYARRHNEYYHVFIVENVVDCTFVGPNCDMNRAYFLVSAQNADSQIFVTIIGRTLGGEPGMNADLWLAHKGLSSRQQLEFDMFVKSKINNFKINNVLEFVQVPALNPAPYEINGSVPSDYRMMIWVRNVSKDQMSAPITLFFSVYDRRGDERLQLFIHIPALGPGENKQVRSYDTRYIDGGSPLYTYEFKGVNIY